MKKIKKFFKLQYYKLVKKECPHFCHLCEFYKDPTFTCNPYEIIER